MCSEANLRSNVAIVAPHRLSIRANNQRVFTQMIYFGGENGGGLAKVDGIDPTDAFGLAKSS